MHLKGYGRQTGAYRDLSEVAVLEEFPHVGPFGAGLLPADIGGERFGDGDVGTHRRRTHRVWPDSAKPAVVEAVK